MILATLGETPEKDVPAKAAKELNEGGAHWIVSRGKLGGLIEIEHRPYGHEEQGIAQRIAIEERQGTQLLVNVQVAEQKLKHAQDHLEAMRSSLEVNKRPLDKENVEAAEAKLKGAELVLKGAKETRGALKATLEALRSRQAECLEAVDAFFIDPASLWNGVYAVEAVPETVLDELHEGQRFQEAG